MAGKPSIRLNLESLEDRWNLSPLALAAPAPEPAPASMAGLVKIYCAPGDPSNPIAVGEKITSIDSRPQACGGIARLGSQLLDIQPEPEPAATDYLLLIDGIKGESASALPEAPVKDAASGRLGGPFLGYHFPSTTDAPAEGRVGYIGWVKDPGAG